MSGIVGSKLNHRGSGLIGSLGTDGQHLLSSGAGKSNVFETVAVPAAYDDGPIKADITALALREATNEASAAFNLPNQFIETFTDDTNLGTQTTGDRTSGYWATVYESIAGSASQLDYFTPTQAGGGTTPYQAYANSSTTGGGSWTDIAVAETEPTKFIDADTAITSASGYWLKWQSPGSTKWFTVDFKENKLFSTSMKIGKNNGWADTNAFKVEYSTNNSDWTGVDFSGSGAASYTRGPPNAGSATGGGLSGTPDSSGNFNIAQHGSSYHYTGFVTMPGIPDFTARYIRTSYLSEHGGTANNDMRNGIMTPYHKAVTSSTSATGTLIQSANTVASAKTKVGGVAFYKDNAGTATLGTDLKIYFSCNNGGAWTEAASYNAITPVYSTGIKQVRLGETTCTSGTGIIYKAVWANQAASSKETQLHGIGINY